LLYVSAGTDLALTLLEAHQTSASLTRPTRDQTNA
jgi:hypothetical protein